MATALIKGIVKANLRRADQIHVFDTSKAQTEANAAFGCKIASSAVELTKACNVLVIAVKPDVVPKVRASAYLRAF